MTSDIVLATSLLVAALLYPSFWMGAAMMLQAFVLAVHAFHLEDGARGFADRLTYARVINAVSYGVLIALAASTLAGWLRRRKALRDVPRDTLPAQPRAA